MGVSRVCSSVDLKLKLPEEEIIRDVIHEQLLKPGAVGKVKTKKIRSLEIHNPIAQKSPIEYIAAPIALEMSVSKSPTVSASFVAIITLQEEIFAKITAIIEDRTLSNRKYIQKETMNVVKERREAEQHTNTSNTFKAISNSTSLITAAVSIGVGISLCSGGAALPVIGGVALILSAIGSISSFVMRQCGVSNAASTAVEVSGGVIGLLSGGISGVSSLINTGVQTTIQTVFPVALKIGTSLIQVSSLSTDAASTVYRQKSLSVEAAIKLLEKTINQNKESVEDAHDLSKAFIDSYNNNLIAVIHALKKESEIVTAMIQRQSQRG